MVPVPVYRWALPEDTAPLKQVSGEILAGHVQVMLITNAAQIDHVMQVSEQEGKTAQFKEACKKMVVASIGPTASERLRHHELTGGFRTLPCEDGHPRQRNERAGPRALGQRDNVRRYRLAIAAFGSRVSWRLLPASLTSRAQRNPSQFIFVLGSVPFR